nr:hypothetical protein [Tanacetum cinerariifolium]
MKEYSKHIDWGQVKITKDIMKGDKEEETEVAKESEDMALSVMKELKANEAMLVEVVQVSSDDDDSSDEGLFANEDVVLFNNFKYPLTDAEIKMFKERPTTSRAPTASTSTRSIAPTASTSNVQAASTSVPRGYMKIDVTRCILSLRSPNDPNAPPPSATRKRKSKK